MKIEKDPDLGTTLWVRGDEYGSPAFNDEVSRLRSSAGKRDKLVIYVSGSEPLAERTKALLTSQLSRL